MKTLTETSRAYQKNLLDKHQFITEMYNEHHIKLFEYSEYLAKTDIQKIEISNKQLLMTIRGSGAKFECPPHDLRVAPIEILNFLEYEKDDASMIGQLSAGLKTFYDIGANMGWYSINIALANPQISIHCFEPLPKTFDYLRRNIKHNNLTNIQAHNFGLSNKVGHFDFYYYKEGSGNASTQNLSGRGDVDIIKCNVDTLDRFTSNNGTKIDFIKCDVEGAELFVFQGGIRRIEKDLPIIFSEILRKWSKKFNYHPNDLLNLLFSLGYQAFVTIGNRLECVVAIDDETTHTNFFFLHTKKHAEQIANLTL